MARLPYLTKEDLPEEHHALLSRDINLAKILAHSVGGAKAMARLGGWIRTQCNLDPRLRELAILQVGYLARAEYEWSHHVKIGRDFGVTDEDVRGLAQESVGSESSLDETTKLVLLAAREITDDLEMSDDTFAKLRPRLGEEGMVDLTIVVSYYNAIVRFLRTMQVDVEPEYQQFLDQHPLPSP